MPKFCPKCFRKTIDSETCIVHGEVEPIEHKTLTIIYNAVAEAIDVTKDENQDYPDSEIISKTLADIITEINITKEVDND